MARRLPAITEPVTIDGYIQPGSSPDTLAVGNDANILSEIDGSGTTAGEFGISFTGGGVTLRGLDVHGFHATNSSGGGTAINGFAPGVLAT